MEFHIHELHQTTTILIGLYEHPSNCRSIIQTSHLYPDLRHHHFRPTSPVIHTPRLFEARSSVTCYFRSRNGVRLTLLQVSRKSSQYEASFHFRIPPRRRRTNRTHQPDLGTVPPHLLQLPAGQLGWTSPNCGIHFQ